LAGVGKLLKTLRGHDRPYRLCGDRFVLILPQTPGAGAGIAMERLREKAPGQTFGATLTFGIATTTGGRISPQELQTQAEHALESGKQNGRNTVVLFEPHPFDAADTGAAENAAALSLHRRGRCAF
jgi:diguanylate cyclase (GGDEF)-like protein